MKSSADKKLLSMVESAFSGRFQITQTLASDEWSVDFRVYDPAEGSRSVLRVLRPQWLQALDIPEFLKSARKAIGLEGPHIHPVTEVDQAGKFVYCLAPWLDGDGLETRLAATSPMSFRDAVAIYRGLAAALQSAEDYGIAHGCPSPRDIHLQSNHARLGFFGWSGALAAAGLSDSRYTDGASVPASPHGDIYSTGVVAYRLLTGEFPTSQLQPDGSGSNRPTPVNALRRHLPPGLALLVMKSLEHEPKARPGSARDLLNLLVRLVTPEPGFVTQGLVHQGEFLMRRGPRWADLARERFVAALDLAPESEAARAGLLALDSGVEVELAPVQTSPPDCTNTRDQDWLESTAPLGTDSITVLIDISNRCNIRCRMCYFSFDSVFHRRAEFLTPEAFRTIAERLFPLAHTVYLSAGSEPMTSPHFSEILKIAAQYAIKDLKFLTNGLLMTEEVSEAILAAGVNQIHFSVVKGRPFGPTPVRPSGPTL